MYLAVLPSYRQECMSLLKDRLGDEIRLYVSSAHLDKSVKTGIDASLYTEVGIRRLFGAKIFLQHGHWLPALRASTLVLDLNPRSVTAWLLLSLRALLRRRTLVWGHLYPVRGAGSFTARLRSSMRRMADGTVTYTYSSKAAALEDLPGKPVWVAPNSLYRAGAIRAVDSGRRDTVLYVGRLAAAKKVGLLVRGFAIYVRHNPEARLALVGGGAIEEDLRLLVDQLGIAERVEMPGWIEGTEDLQTYYARAFTTVSPGFAGLGLTQSLGFGVPSAVAKDEPHSPEIELADTGAVSWFESDSPPALARALSDAWARRSALPLEDVSAKVRTLYSAEAMADGLAAALLDEAQMTVDENGGI